MEIVTKLNGYSLTGVRTIKNNIHEISSVVVKYPEKPFVEYDLQTGNIKHSHKKNSYYIDFKLHIPAFFL